MADIRTDIGGLRLKNPVMTASGTFGYGLEFADLVNLEDIGGIMGCRTKAWIIFANTSIHRSRTSARI